MFELGSFGKRWIFASIFLLAVSRPALAHTPVESIAMLEGVLVFPLIAAIVLIPSRLRRRAVYYFSILVGALNFLVFSEIHDAVFWACIVMPYAVLLYVAVVRFRGHWRKNEPK